MTWAFHRFPPSARSINDILARHQGKPSAGEDETQIAGKGAVTQRSDFRMAVGPFQRTVNQRSDKCLTGILQTGAAIFFVDGGGQLFAYELRQTAKNPDVVLCKPFPHEERVE